MPLVTRINKITSETWREIFYESGRERHVKRVYLILTKVSFCRAYIFQDVQNTGSYENILLLLLYYCKCRTGLKDSTIESRDIYIFLHLLLFSLLLCPQIFPKDQNLN